MKKSYALVIGVDSYAGGFPSLEASYSDAVRMKDFLLTVAKFDHVHLLTGRAATKERVSQLMEDVLPAAVHDDDRFLFYFSGHGVSRALEGGGNEGYLAFANSHQGKFAEMIGMRRVEEWDDLLRHARHVLFVLDSCFSGLAGIQVKSGAEDKTLDRLARRSHYVITAGTGSQTSLASLQRWNGSLFTDSFIRGATGVADLGSNDHPPDGIVSLHEILLYVQTRVDEEAAKDSRVDMSPQVSDLAANEGEFFFVNPTRPAPSGRPAVPTPTPPAQSKAPVSEEDVTQPIRSIFRAWEELDLDTYLSQWTPDAIQYTNKRYRTFSEIKAKRTKDFSRFRKVVVDQVALKVRSVSPLNDVVAIDGTYSMSFFLDDGRTIHEPDTREFYLVRLDRSSGRWLIAENRDYINVPTK